MTSDKGLNYDNIEFLVENIQPNIEKLKLESSLLFHEEHLEILLHRCNKIKILGIRVITDRSLMKIRQYLNLTLEELSLAYYEFLCFTVIIELTSMSRFRILDLYSNKCISSNGEESQNIRQHLPHIMIRTFFDN